MSFERQEVLEKWLAHRFPEDIDMSFIMDDLWADLETFLEKCSEFVRVKAAVVGCKDDDILGDVMFFMGGIIDGKFPEVEDASFLLCDRVRARRSVPVDLEKLVSAREFLRPFEDYRRRIVETGK